MNTHAIELNNGCEICQMWLNSSENWNPDTKAESKKELEYHTIREMSVPAGNSIPEVYAANIMENQLIKIIPNKELTNERIESERRRFLEFLKEKWELGWRFENQQIAWLDYLDTIDNDDFVGDELETDWQLEIDEIVSQAQRVGNYSEFGGQQ